MIFAISATLHYFYKQLKSVKLDFKHHSAYKVKHQPFPWINANDEPKYLTRRKQWIYWHIKKCQKCKILKLWGNLEETSEVPWASRKQEWWGDLGDFTKRKSKLLSYSVVCTGDFQKHTVGTCSRDEYRGPRPLMPFSFSTTLWWLTAVCLDLQLQ